MNYIKSIGSNKVFEGKDCYHIQAPKKEIFVSVDKDNKLLDYIEKYIKKCGNLNYVSKRYPFEFQKGYKGTKLYISKLIYCYYHRIKLTEMNRLHIVFKDGNQFNCKNTNMIDTRKNNRNMTITHDSDYIYIEHINKGLLFVTNFEPDLYKLITSTRLAWSVRDLNRSNSGNDDYRLVAQLYYHNKKCSRYPQTVTISKLVYGYYYYGIRLSNLSTRLREMNKYLNDNGLFIDHLISNGANNTVANLSAIDRGLNSTKQFIDKQIIPPYYLIMAHKDNVYKAVFCFIVGMVFVLPVITCNSMQELLQELKIVATSNPFNEYKSALEWRTEGDIKSYNLPDSYKVQRVLYDNFDNPLVDMKVAQYIDVYYNE